ncbi:MAG: MazG nucleotide pyrophosphohydrolase domain-containing protein [Halodesulfurarchaeum sp.]
MDAQDRVAEFLAAHQLETDPTFRLFDLVSEVGELAKSVNTSTRYGQKPDRIALDESEYGDVLFATLALGAESGFDADEALETAIQKYRTRMELGEDPGSG